MIQTGMLIFTAVLYLALFGFSIFIFYQQYTHQSILHALLGFFIPIYGYIWGWLNARRLDMMDIMVFWTVFTLLAIIFPIAISFQTISQLSG